MRFEFVMLLLFVFLYASTFVSSKADTHTETRNVGHIVLITSPFFGHMIPILDFAKRLSLHHHVTYVVSASKLNILKQYGFLDENSGSTQSRLEIIGLYDGNDDDYEVSLIAQ
jgi:hypothetical protein